MIWKLPTPPRRMPKATPLVLPSMHDLAGIARHLATATSLAGAIAQLQRDVCKLLSVPTAACIWIDWPHDRAWTLDGVAGAQLHELATAVAGSGRRSIVGSTLVEPLGRPPARAVLALRKPPGATYDSSELTLIHTLASGIAPALDRLIREDAAI